MQIYPYLIFNGNAADAMTFYQQVLGGELNIVRFSEMPDADSKANPEDSNRVLNARLQCDEAVFMASDSPSSWPTGPMDAFSVALVFDDQDRAANVFEALSSDGVVTMPWGPTFWAAGFGMLTDKYGVTWMVNSGVAEPS